MAQLSGTAAPAGQSGQWGTQSWSTNPTTGMMTQGFTPSLYAGSQSELAKAQAAHAGDQLAATQLTEGDKMNRFNAILPMLSGQLLSGNGGAFTAGGSNTAPPPITAGPVYNAQQMQQAQNANASQISAGAATQNQQTNNSLAGRGFGSNSPLSMALQGANDSNARGQIASSNTQLGLQGAQANATQLTNSQNALSNQWATGNQLDINRRTPYVQQRTALLQSLAGLV